MDSAKKPTACQLGLILFVVLQPHYQSYTYAL